MRFILTTFLTACLFLIACKNNSDATKSDTTTEGTTTNEMPAAPEAPTTAPTISTEPVPGQATTTTDGKETTITMPQKKEPAQNADGVWHFTCPKGCKGGGGAVGPCAKCGATLAHNAAYHASAPPPVQTQGGNVTVPTTASGTPTPAPKAEPAQNAKGVWHFTCSKGCAGGGGSASPCAKCGTTLVHNAAYHQ